MGLMREQGFEEPVGRAKITKGYNLPAKYVLHTVGPAVSGKVTEEDKKMLESCYRSCLELAEFHRVRSVAFCCISTGVFCFPNELAAEIAVRTVRECLKESEIQKYGRSVCLGMNFWQGFLQTMSGYWHIQHGHCGFLCPCPPFSGYRWPASTVWWRWGMHRWQSSFLFTGRFFF